MLLTSSEYFAFLAILFFAFWLTMRWRQPAMGLILLANLLFLGRWGVIYLALVPLCAICDFMIGRAIERNTATPVRRILLWVSIILNLSLIVTSKLPTSSVGIALPLSLSFYAFQSLTYTIDIYRKDGKAAPNLWTYLTSVLFFPTMLAGPITRMTSLAPQWARLKVPLSPEDGGKALYLIALGGCKKFLIADYLAENLVNRVFDTPALYSAFEVLVGAYGYAFQLYYDFSGYSDIAIGSALLLGLKLPANFNRPYEALNLADFWRRWHISLSSWLRDYLYFSLPGLRSKWKIFTYWNLALTMILGGIWHGFTWNFLIWGSLHGFGLAVNRWWQVTRGEKKPYSEFFLARFLRGFATFHFVLLAWIFFRAESLQGALDMLTILASGTFATDNISPGYAVVLGAGVLFHYLPKNWYATSMRVFIEAPAFAQGVAVALAVACIQYVSATGAAPFMYQKF
ncbi:alginate O-acetyltransferase [Bryobacterales bacterium F-183]|nr:alginate O-acetyltransferase [Bryobacterales bacterium F-183]